jgi:hypothetical protein
LTNVKIAVLALIAKTQNPEVNETPISSNPPSVVYVNERRAMVRTRARS